VPVYVAMQPPDWQLPLDALEAAITPRTRGIMVNTPANPTGKVFSRAELEAIGALAVRHDLWIFTDEVYEHFVFDGREHVSAAALPGLRERTITMNALSKTFAITGWPWRSTQPANPAPEGERLHASDLARASPCARMVTRVPVTAIIHA